MENKEPIIITFRNYGKAEKKSIIEEIQIPLTKVSGTTRDVTVTKEETEDVDKEIIELRKYGFYTVVVNDESLANSYTIQIGETLKFHSDKYFNKSNGQKEFLDSDHIFPFWEYSGEALEIVLNCGNDVYKNTNKICLVNDEDIHSELVNMVKIVYDKQPNLLYSAFQRAPLEVFVDKNHSIKQSIDAKLLMIETVVDVYHKQYSDIRKSLKFKLNERSSFDRIDKLTKMDSKTISFMVQNPQYLHQIKRNIGIHYKGKNYLPEKTRIIEQYRDYDIYENRYILTFLKMVKDECDNILHAINRMKKVAEQEEYSTQIESKKADFRSWKHKCDEQYTIASKHQKNLRRLYVQYQSLIQIDDYKLNVAKLKSPVQTAIFRQLSEYHEFYKKAFTPWYHEGMSIKTDISDVDKKNIITTAVSDANTTYELFIVTMWIAFFEEQGYKLSSKRYAGINERDKRYLNKAYEFVFKKDDETFTLYYSPDVYYYDINSNEIDENNVDDILFRNTKNVMRDEDDISENHNSCHYAPDFILKYTKSNRVRYMIADAKHKDYSQVVEHDMPRLVFKYNTSFGVRNHEVYTDAAIAGLCAIYYKNQQNHKDFDYQKTPYRESNSKSTQKTFFSHLLHMDYQVDSSLSEDNWKLWSRNFNEILEEMINFGAVDLIQAIKKLKGASKDDLEDVFSKLNLDSDCIPQLMESLNNKVITLK